MYYSIPRDRRVRQEKGSAQQHRTATCLQIGHTWAELGGMGGPLGSSANPPKLTLAGAYLNT
jgi:hypothetical protein